MHQQRCSRSDGRVDERKRCKTRHPRNARGERERERERARERDGEISPKIENSVIYEFFNRQK